MERQPLHERQIFNSNDNVMPRKMSAIVQPVRNESQEMRPLFLSPVLPGTGSITHNVTRLLATKGENSEQTNTQDTEYIGQYVCASRQQLFNTPKGNNSTTSEDDLIDVENESHDLMRTCDAPNNTDSSMSTRGSASPQSTEGKPSPTSSTSSPGSGCGSATSPEPEGPPVRKKVRTNYRPDQVKALERQFHENPYPDADMMEQLSLDLGIPENKLKIWFQNKRARWRRRVNDNMNNPYNHHFMSMSPVLPPQMTPYGFMPAAPFMTSSPTQGMPGFFNYQGSPNNNHTNQNVSRLQSANQIQNNNQLTTQGMHSTASTTAHSLMTSPNQYLSHNYRHLQYPPYLYQNFATYSPKN